MEPFRIERTGALDLEFEGELLADVSSRLDNAPRWTEVRIYRTSTGRYVTEQIGLSVYASEKERRDVRVVESPDDLPKALERVSNDGRSYLTKTVLDALDEAAERDPAIRGVTTERI